ncbi:MAG: methyltransferase [Halofilum sp. (in: g-proteobacteria)]
MPGVPEAPRIELALTTNPGLEDVVAAELRDHLISAGHDPAVLNCPPSGIAGRVRADMALSIEAARAVATRLRSVHHVLRHVDSFRLPPTGALEVVRRRIAALAWPELDVSTPFRVSSTRSGEHEFTSQELQAAAGAAVQAGTGAPVDLEHYRVHVAVDAIGSHCSVGIRWTERPLGLRHERTFSQRVALKSPIAYAMLRLGCAGMVAPERILDPFCGSGTILLEAAQIFPGAALAGSDLRPACVEGTRANLALQGNEKRAELRTGDVRAIVEHHEPGSFDLIVTNPPYGKRLGRKIHFVRFYQDILATAAALLRPGGRLVLLAGKRGAFHVAVQRSDGWRRVHSRDIEMSRIHVALVVVERR